MSEDSKPNPIVRIIAMGTAVIAFLVYSGITMEHGPSFVGLIIVCMVYWVCVAFDVRTINDRDARNTQIAGAVFGFMIILALALPEFF